MVDVKVVVTLSIIKTLTNDGLKKELLAYTVTLAISNIVAMVIVELASFC
jgi:hypothetical protein